MSDVAKNKPAALRDPAVRVVLLPRDTNQHGTIFGGIILSYIDIAGGVEAHKHTDNPVVTVAMKEVVFKEPVLVGEVVSFYTQTTRLGKTSISIHVDVEVNRRGEIIHVTEADLVFVSVDAHGRPTPIEAK